MEPETPAAPPESGVIRLARTAMGITAQAAAEATRAQDGRGVSVTYWRDVERGYGGRRGKRVPTRASAAALAAMARVVGVMPSQLTAAGREDAARVLDEILRREGLPAAPRPSAAPRFSPEMEEAVEPLLPGILARVEVAQAAHPGQPLTGEQVFPRSPGAARPRPAARAWDILAAAGDPPETVARNLAAVQSWAAELAAQDSANAAG